METLIWNNDMFVSAIILTLTFVAVFTEEIHKIHRVKSAMAGAAGGGRPLWRRTPEPTSGICGPSGGGRRTPRQHMERCRWRVEEAVPAGARGRVHGPGLAVHRGEMQVG